MTVGYNCIRSESHEPIERFEAALDEAYAAGLLGKDLRGSGIDFDLYTYLGSRAHICGDEAALLESIEVNKGQPRYKPPFPAKTGLYGMPTTINNSKSLASVPVILEEVGQWFLEQGRPNNGGLKLLCVPGHVNKPANFEVLGCHTDWRSPRRRQIEQNSRVCWLFYDRHALAITETVFEDRCHS